MTVKKGCIAVFAKTPGLSPLKTRLAKDIGADEAEKIYHGCVDAVQLTLVDFCKKNTDWDVVWALGEEQGTDNSFWKQRPFNKIWTGDGGLGTRLCHIDTLLKESYQHIILIGTDCPHIPLAFFNKAVSALSKDSIIVGPSTDGGYYLFGSSEPIDSSLWESVPYSEDNTLDIFLNLLGNKTAIACLESLTDLDDINDVTLILNEAERLEQDLSLEYIRKLKSL